MAKKIEHLLERYQENVYPAMLKDLATHLGVSFNSLARLAVGWAPVVPFKKGDNYQGWWVIPERNQQGDVIGLGLRSQNDHKVMFPGSGRGLIYVLNPEHIKGNPISEYRAGPQNWVRTMEAQVNCPVCEKPDGCLISTEDTDDPQAAICIRVSKGSKKAVRGGNSWLHILKPTGDVRSNATLLEASKYPVIIVEGMTDTAAAMDLGFVAVGRPNANSGLMELADLVRGRKVIIVGENDLKPDGSCPGREGMLATAQVLRRSCPDVLKLMPPTDCKDLRAWIGTHQVTAESFLEYAAERGDRSTELVVLSDDQPRSAGLAYLADQFQIGDRYTLRKWKGNSFYLFKGYKYIEAEEIDVTGPLYDWAVGKSNTVLDKNGEPQIKPIKADRRWAGNVMASIHNTIMLDPDSAAPPTWINGVVGPKAHDLIPFTNGLVDVPRFLAGESYLMDNTPDYFNLIAVPYAFDETATCDLWLKFLDEALGDDPQKIQLLQQWFGYCLTFDNQFQKFMILRGVKQSGKSTILNILHAIVGVDQYFSATFDELQGQFGLEDAIGKLVCGIDEAQITRKTDVQAVMDVIRTVSGNAAKGVTRKFKKKLTIPLRARFTLTCNETPYLPDNADAMARRMLLLEFTTESGRPDPFLLGKLEKELPGIAIWGMEGLRSLHAETADGTPAGFIIPLSMQQGLEAWREFANPVGTFYNECCIHSIGQDTSALEIMDACVAWCLERNLKAPSIARFYERLKFTAPAGVGREKRIHANTNRPFNVITNLTLQPWARNAYLQGVK